MLIAQQLAGAIKISITAGGAAAQVDTAVSGNPGALLQLVLLICKLSDASLKTNVEVARRLYFVINNLNANSVVVLYLSYTGALLGKCFKVNISGGFNLGLCALNTCSNLFLLEASVVTKLFELLVIGNAVVHNVDKVAKDSV